MMIRKIGRRDRTILELKGKRMVLRKVGWYAEHITLVPFSWLGVIEEPSPEKVKHKARA